MRVLAVVVIAAAAIVPSGAVAEPACSLTVCADARADTVASGCFPDENGRYACSIVARATGEASSIYGAGPVWTPGIMNLTIRIESCRWTRGDLSSDCSQLIGPATVLTRWGGALLTNGATASAAFQTPWFPVPVGAGPCTTVEWTLAADIHARTDIAPVEEGVRRTRTADFGTSICID